MSDLEYVKPEDIERRSFEIISAELEAMGKSIPKEQEPVTKRVIHTSADFSYADTMMYSENAVEIAKKLIASGADIVTDTNMGLSGINEKRLSGFGGAVSLRRTDAGHDGRIPAGKCSQPRRQRHRHLRAVVLV